MRTATLVLAIFGLIALAAFASIVRAQTRPLSLTESLDAFVPHGFGADSLLGQLIAVEGDTWTYDATLGGQADGSSSGTCVTLSRNRTRCQITLSLPGGRLELNGQLAPGGGTVAVSGGTGDYSHARGQATARTRSRVNGLVRDLTTWTITIT